MHQETLCFKCDTWTLPTVYFSTLYQLDSLQQQHRATSESFQQAGGIMVMSQRPGAWWVWRWVCRGWLVRIWGRLWKYEGLDFRFPPKLPRLRESYLKQISFLWRSVSPSARLSVICVCSLFFLSVSRRTDAGQPVCYVTLSGLWLQMAAAESSAHTGEHTVVSVDMFQA